MPRGGQAACPRIEAKGDDGVAVLVGGQEEVPGRIEGEVPGCFPPCGFVPQRGEPAAPLVNGEDGDAVVTAVGAVNESAGGVNVDIGAMAGAAEIVGQGRKGL